MRKLILARLSKVEGCVGNLIIGGRGRGEGVGRVSLRFALIEFLGSNNGESGGRTDCQSLNAECPTYS